ncbi:ABC transporter substrate-binding protein/permease [Aerococcaceae bacterium WGS1372]
MKYFKWLSLTLIVMLLTLVGAPVLSQQVTAQVNDKTYLIATDTTFAPFEYQDENGEYIGIDMDLLKAIAEDQGFNYEIRPLGFSAAIQAIESGQADGMIAAMSITDERRESFDFSDPYYQAGVQFAVLEDSDIQSLKDLKGKKVAVKTGTQGMSVAESVADEYGFEVTIFEDSINMYEDLQAGNSQALIEDKPVMAYAAETGGFPLRFIGEQMEVSDFGFAVKKDENSELLEMFNEGLANLQESGEYDEIIATHVGSSDTKDEDSEQADSEEVSEDATNNAVVVADLDTTYVIGTDTTFAPFEFQDENGDFVGIDMDLLKAIAEDQGFNYEIRPLGFNAALQAVEAGQVDGMIAGMSITDERRESFDFSETYFSAGVQFAVLEDSEFQSLEDLEGENVAVKTGTQGMAVAESIADEYGFSITTFEDSVNMYEDLQAGNSVAVIEDYPVMAYAAQTGGIPLRFIGEQMEVADYGFAVQKGQNSDLVALFNQGLNNLKESGEYDEIVAEYLGESSTDSEATATGNSDQEAVVADPDTTYVIGTDTTFAPFEFQDENGDFVGIDMDLLKAIAEDQGFNYEIRPLGFNAALQAVEAGQVDGMIAGMSITDERRESFDFSETYFSAGVQFAVLEDSEFQSLEDLEGENVAVKTGTQGMAVAESIADEYGFSITTFEDSVNMYEDLQAGNSVAVIEDYPVMAYAAQTGGIPLRFIGEQMEVADYGFAVQKGQNSDLVALFNQGLNNLKKSGEYDAVVAEYLGESEVEGSEEAVVSTNPFVRLIQTNGKALLNGLWTTLWVTLVSFAIAAVLGIIVGLMRTSGVGILTVVAQIYIDIMRGMPLIVLAFFIYFGIPQLTGMQFGAYAAGITTLSLNAAAYIAEIVRGGINAVDQGQSEAARSLGLSQSKTMQRIILPQAFRIMIPSFINQFVITLKDTSILSVIGLVELTQTGRIIIARTYQSGAMWLIVGLMYIILITILTKISNRLEKEL